VSLLATRLELLQVLPKLNEGLILVVLTRDICAVSAELVELLLEILCGGFDERPDTLDVLVVVHLCAGISDDANVLGEEVVSVLFDLLGEYSEFGLLDSQDQRARGTRIVSARKCHVQPQVAYRLLLCQIS
jgi:hypothetical protein